MNVDSNQKFFTCECGSLDHIFVLNYFNDDEDVEMYLSPRMNPECSIFKRILIAFRYIFKYKNRFGSEYEEVILDKEKILDLRDYLNTFLAFKCSYTSRDFKSYQDWEYRIRRAVSARRKEQEYLNLSTYIINKIDTILYSKNRRITFLDIHTLNSILSMTLPTWEKCKKFEDSRIII